MTQKQEDPNKKKKMMNGLKSGHLSQEMQSKIGLAILGKTIISSMVLLNQNIARIWGLKYQMIKKRMNWLKKLKKSVRGTKIEIPLVNSIGKNVLIELIISYRKLGSIKKIEAKKVGSLLMILIKQSMLKTNSSIIHLMENLFIKEKRIGDLLILLY